MKKLSYENLLKTSVMTLCIIAIMVAPAMAGTDGQELSGAYNQIKGLLTGMGGKLIAIVSWVFSIVGCFAKFNFGAVATSFGVAIATTAAPLFVDATVTCLLNF